MRRANRFPEGFPQVSNTCRLNVSSLKPKSDSHLPNQENQSSAAVPAVVDESTLEESSERPTTRRSVGTLHNKELCIFCMKPDDLKHDKKTNSIE